MSKFPTVIPSRIRTVSMSLFSSWSAYILSLSCGRSVGYSVIIRPFCVSQFNLIYFEKKMILKILIIFALFFIVLVDCQVCTKNVLTKSTATETYRKILTSTYKTYEGRCRIRGCVRSRPRYVRATRLGTISKMEIVQYCCDGYIESQNSTQQSNITCLPVCTPACVNGYCRSPGECACNVGYTPDPYNLRSCQPSCADGCLHGTCVAPDTCTCNFGYSMTNGTCEPICTESCINANCVGPETCECLLGYRKSANNTCDPYCSSGCENGTCIGPESCQCNLGYRMEEANTFTNSCRPVCSTSCEHGTCIAPETCSCDSGYIQLNNTCEPYCSDGCENGTCVQPETCLCNPGYVKVFNPPEKPTCGPICTDRCDYGTCVAPDTCHCHSGYIKSNNTCVPYCSSGCANGFCFASELCQCNSGWALNNSSNECEPVCSQPCGNGTCVAPDICKCYNGYIWDKTCRRENTGCAHGQYASPNVCVCDSGWAKQNGTCRPVCAHDCGNGTCISPNVCECFKGYRIDNGKLIRGLTGSLCVPFCLKCKGDCVAPFVCKPKVSPKGIRIPFGDYNDDEDDEEGSGLSGPTIPDISTTPTISERSTTTLHNDSSYGLNTTIPKDDDMDPKINSAPMSWVNQYWWLIAFPVLLIILLIITVLLACKWKSICRYFKGGSYAVEEHNASTLQRTTPFINVTFSDLEKKDKM